MVLVALIGLGINTGGQGNDGTIALPVTSSTSVETLPVSLVTKVTQSARAALEDISSLDVTDRTESFDVQSGDITASQAAIVEHHYVYAIDGSYRDTWTTTYPNKNVDKFDSSYRADTGTMQSCSSTADSKTMCITRFGYNDQPQAIGGMASLIDQASKSPNATAVEATSGEKRVWTVSFDQDSSFGTLHSTVTVDQATGLPLSSEQRIEEGVIGRSTLTNVIVNPKVDTKALQVTIPKNVIYNDERTADYNTDGTSFDHVVSAKYKSRLPLVKPEGFTTNEVFTSAHALISPSDDCGTVYPMAETVSRNGLFVIDTKVLDKTVCSDAKADATYFYGDSELHKVSTITANGGALKGASFTAYRLLTGQLFIVGESSTNIVYATGDLRTDQLQQYVDSFTIS
jgi:hypothetical protein